MTQLRLLLCDDEPLALDRLADLASRCEGVTVSDAVLSGTILIERLRETAADVVLLDIEMPHMDGFDVVEALSRIEWAGSRQPPLIVFVTAHPELAAHAFDSGALDFISKPVRLSRLEQAVARARRAIEQAEAGRRLKELSSQLDALKRMHGRGPDEQHIWLRKGAETVRVDLADIDWVSAEGEYARFHIDAVSYLERGGLTQASALLAPAGFVRVHRSAIVNGHKVVAIEQGKWGSLILRLGSGARIPVGKKYRPAARHLAVKDSEAGVRGSAPE